MLPDIDENWRNPSGIIKRAAVDAAGDEGSEEYEHGCACENRREVEALGFELPGKQEKRHFKNRQGRNCRWLPNHVKTGVSQPAWVGGVCAVQIEKDSCETLDDAEGAQQDVRCRVKMHAGSACVSGL